VTIAFAHHPIALPSAPWYSTKVTVVYDYRHGTRGQNLP
jgi:hypothetical protein